MRTVTAIMGGLAIPCAVLNGCIFSAGMSSTPTVAKDALQKDITDRLAKAGEKPESVTCSEDLVGEVGKTTRCEVVMGPTNSFEPVVTVTGVDGSTINYDMTPAVSKDPTRGGGLTAGRRCRGSARRLGVGEAGLEGRSAPVTTAT